MKISELNISALQDLRDVSITKKKNGYIDINMPTGWMELDYGAFGEVYSNNKFQYVIKVLSNKDTAYTQFVDFAKKNSNKHYPKIAGPIQIDKKYTAYAIEKLDSLPKNFNKFFPLLTWFKNYAMKKTKSFPKALSELLVEFKKIYGPSFISAMIQLYRWFPKDLIWDLTRSNPNIMLRPQTNDLVIIDPVTIF